MLAVIMRFILLVFFLPLACSAQPSPGAPDAGGDVDAVRDLGRDLPDLLVDASADVAPEALEEVGIDVSEPFEPAPWPPPELTVAPPAQPDGAGWRTAAWNICTTRMDGGRLECRARIDPQDEGRTAAMIERAAIAKYFVEDDNMYSFTLQEICEQDARWIAAFVANGGPPARGWDMDFSAVEYAAIDELAPYVFLPYMTHEMVDTRDLGCGVGVSTGIAAIARRKPDTTGLKLQGLTNATYALRVGTGLTAAMLAEPDICALYFEAQTSYDPVDPDDAASPLRAVMDFRTGGCTSSVPDTLRGVACVRTRWEGPGGPTDYRVSTCATHAVHKGAVAGRVRNYQIDEAATMLFDFAGGAGQRSILSGDFNVVARRGSASNLDSGEVGHHTLLTSGRHGFGKVTVGDEVGGTGTGTHRGNCGREIDAIYVRNAWWLQSPSPNASPCRAYGDADPVSRGVEANPYDWSDHERVVSPLMMPTGNGPADF